MSKSQTPSTTSSTSFSTASGSYELELCSYEEITVDDEIEITVCEEDEITICEEDDVDVDMQVSMNEGSALPFLPYTWLKRRYFQFKISTSLIAFRAAT